MVFRVIFLVFALCLSSLFGAIGFSMTSLNDEARNREIPIAIWYPTNEQDGVRIFGDNVAFEGFEAIEEAEIIDKKLPLYILIHGTGGNWRNLSWLGSKLAKKAIVIAASHPNYSTGQARAKTVLRAWEQPKDVNFMIEAMGESDYSENLNGDIFVIGHSLGGYSALALVGAKIDLTKMQKFCEKNSDVSCSYFKDELKNITQKDIEASKIDLANDKIKKIIALTPAYFNVMTKESLQSIKQPTLIITAQFDKNVPIKTYFEPYKQNLSKKVLHVNIKDGGHFSFLQICKLGAKELLAKENSTSVCDDGEDGKTREAIHSETFKAISDFLDF